MIVYCNFFGQIDDYALQLLVAAAVLSDRNQNTCFVKRVESKPESTPDCVVKYVNDTLRMSGTTNDGGLEVEGLS